MDPALLKARTASDHDRAEKAMRVMEPDLDRAAYVSILRRLYGFIRGWEIWTESVTQMDLCRHLTVRRRSELLRSDLHAFSAVPSEDFYPGPHISLENEFHVLGAMYVIEGSTLGGQYIARHVERVLHLNQGVGNSYFLGYGDRTGQMWREIKELLQAVPVGGSDEVIFAARTLFADFEAWNSDVQEPPSKGSVNA